MRLQRRFEALDLGDGVQARIEADGLAAGQVLGQPLADVAARATLETSIRPGSTSARACTV